MSTARAPRRRALPEIVNLDGDNHHLANLCGPLDENLKQIADGFDVQLARRGNRVTLDGENAELAARSLRRFHQQAVHRELNVEDIQLGVVEMKAQAAAAQAAELAAKAAAERLTQKTPAPGVADAALELPPLDDEGDVIALRTRRSDLRPRTPRQRDYLNNILKHDITFGVGPAGTGKTWLAVACAIDALERETVQRIVLTRPAVEAGERLGFLPGDLAQKVDPYLRPLYDALYDLMGFERVQKLFEKQAIEIAPLAYMRGRTLNHAFVILDEAQNTSPEQMKMFLTRIGFGSKAVITGDPSQVDLPRGHKSGLAHAVTVLEAVNGIATTRFTSRDVVRHPLVARIVDAYEQAAEHDGHA
jgi:phosphate starvation-inducible PhoH-like protein